MIEGSPFESKNLASKALGINRRVIDLFLDSDKGVKGSYLYTRALTHEQI